MPASHGARLDPATDAVHRWRELYLLVSLELRSIEHLLTLASQLICSAMDAEACCVTHVSPRGDYIQVHHGDHSMRTSEALLKAEALLEEGRLAPVCYEINGKACVSLPLTSGHEYMGVVHVISSRAPGDLTELQFAIMLVSNVLRRQHVADQVVVTERRRVEKGLAVQYAVTSVLAASATLGEAIPRLLQTIGERLHWDMGLLWTVDRSAGVLRCDGFWHTPAIETRSFEADCLAATFSPGHGLPGRVWLTGTAVSIPNLVRDPQFPRAFVAAGLHGALGFPITNGAEVCGVLEYFSRGVLHPDPDVFSSMSTIASQIGQFIERKRAEEALYESEERFRLLVDGVQDYAIYMLDTHGHVVSWNTGAEHIKGYRADEIIGRHFSIFYPAEDVDLGKPQQDIREAVVNGRFVDEGLRIRKDGSRFYASHAITALRDENGQLRGFAKVTRDITDRKRAEAALHEANEQFRTTFEQAAVGIAHVGLDGRWLRVNQRLCAITGYTREELLTGVFQDITHPEDLEGDLENVRYLLENRIQKYAMEKRYIRKDGSIIWVQLTVSLVRDAGGAPKYFISVIEDIAARKQMENENARLYNELRIERDRLVRREVEVRAQIGRDLHDGPVQQVAVAVIGVQHARRVAQREPRLLPETLNDLEEQLKRVTHDLRNVLYDLRPLGINEEGLEGVLRQYVERFRDPSGLRIWLDVPHNLRRLDVDREAAAFIVVQEAVNNARKHAHARDIWISVGDTGDALHIEVRDNGRGFDLDATQTNYVKRGSFGLLNMRERAQLIGGTCELWSQPGRGTTVTVQVPVEVTSPTPSHEDVAMSH